MMKASDIIIARPDSDSKIEALKAFMKAMKIKFEISNETEYDPDFVAEILQGDEDFKKGNYEVIKTEDLWK